MITPNRPYPIEQFLDAVIENGYQVRPGSGRWLKVNGRLVFGVLLDDGPVADPAPAFRADNERAWAAVWTALGQGWKYEALEPELSRALRYRPDFWMTEARAWIEIKSAPPTPGEIRVARELLQADGHPVYILQGWPGKGRYRVWLFATNGEAQTQRPDWCDLVLCQLFDCKFSELRAAFAAVRKAYRK